MGHTIGIVGKDEKARGEGGGGQLEFFLLDV